jgi:hypothetical protein
VGERHSDSRQLGRDAERLWAEQGQHDTGMAGAMSDERPKVCIYPGCERPALPPHPLGGPQPSFCDDEQHNALTAHQERERIARRAQSENIETAVREEVQ